MNPQQQHEAQAKSILKRRANANNNETGVATKPSTAKTEVKKTEVKKTEVVPAKVETKVPNAGAGTNLYDGKSLNELRELCKTKNIKFKNKHKADALIAKLEA